MSKKTFKYNPDSLHFETIDKGCKGKIFRFIQFFFAGLICVIGMYIVYINYFDTYKAKNLERKNNALIEKYISLNKEFAELESSLGEIAVKDDKIYRAVLGKNPLGEDIRDAGIGGTDRYSEFEKFNNYEILKEATQNLDILVNKLKIQKKSFTEVTTDVIDHQKTIEGTPYIQPMSKTDYRRISDSYGWRIHPTKKRRIFHEGIDFAGPLRANIYATAKGKVVVARYNKFGYGNEVVIEHFGGIETRYAHLDKILVKEGQTVNRGEKIGLLGNTGISTGPHLHYEVIVNGKKMNPEDHDDNNDLTVEDYKQIIKFSQQN